MGDAIPGFYDLVVQNYVAAVLPATNQPVHVLIVLRIVEAVKSLESGVVALASEVDEHLVTDVLLYPLAEEAVDVLDRVLI